MDRKNVAVIGGGLMGAGIAQVFACAGYRVSVCEPSDEARATIHTRIRENLSAIDLETSAADNVEVMASIEEAVPSAFFITEAAPEKLELKRQIFQKLTDFAPSSAILASNSSVMPIGDISADLETAERIIGTHWWNPAPLIPLVEVIQGESTADETVVQTMSILKKIGKEPAHVKKDVPGFVANRLQHALWREAIAMVAEGICDAKTVDDCVKNSFGMRLPVLGPLENADLVGMELTQDIHRIIIPELDRSDGPNPILSEMIEKGRLGFKSGVGFQEWTSDEQASVRKRLVDHLVAANRTRSNRA